MQKLLIRPRFSQSYVSARRRLVSLLWAAACAAIPVFARGKPDAPDGAGIAFRRRRARRVDQADLA